MIKFFRKIRHRLLTENKFSKYLLYAIGEIILVVIGILIALQINTWNNNKIEKRKEHASLMQLKEGLNTDRETLEYELEKAEKAQRSIKKLEMMLEDPDHSYDPSMDSLFGSVYGMRNLRLNKAFYEDLKSAGIQLIKNENIRSKIVNIYENNYQLIFSIEKMEIHVNEAIRPYYLKHFQKIEFGSSAKPVDYESIWIDPYFKNIVNYRYKTIEFNHVTFFKTTIKDIQSLVQEIDEYLNSN
jgi:hypothetical protein